MMSAISITDNNLVGNLLCAPVISWRVVAAQQAATHRIHTLSKSCLLSLQGHRRGRSEWSLQQGGRRLQRGGCLLLRQPHIKIGQRKIPEERTEFVRLVSVGCFLFADASAVSPNTYNTAASVREKLLESLSPPARRFPPVLWA